MEEGGFFQPVLDALVWVFDQFYELLLFCISVVMLLAGKLFYDVSLEVVQLSWTVAQEVIADLDMSAYIVDAWTALPPETRQMLAFFRVPEVVNLLMSLGVTKFMLRFIPFM